MFSQVISGALQGLESEVIIVETDLSPGLPVLTVVGLPDQSVKEARDRIRAAITNSGYAFPPKRITINLSPANTRKEGTHFDLPIAAGVLVSSGTVCNRLLKDCAILGELSLDGHVNGIRGALPLIIGLRNQGVRKIILPAANANEASIIKDVELLPVNSLRQAAEYLSGKTGIPPFVSGIVLPTQITGIQDFSEVAGQESVKRALQISAAASHNVLMIGPPGAGKTMMARRIPGILPKMTYEEQLEVTKIYSIAGELDDSRAMIQERPFRDPHHTITATSLVGGGTRPRPGEISMAHYGVLFLDELPEYRRHVLELLRQPMEDERITIARVHSVLTFPSKFMLVAAMNPCPCGYFGDSTHECTCSGSQIHNYLSRISGPLMDRIDLHIQIQPVSFPDLFSENHYKGTDEMRSEVEAARVVQLDRFGQDPISYNSQMSPLLVKKYCTLQEDAKALLEEASKKMGFSARAHHKILKIARTIADMEAQDHIALHHVAEAIQYRSLDKLYRGGSS